MPTALVAPVESIADIHVRLVQPPNVCPRLSTADVVITLTVASELHDKNAKESCSHEERSIAGMAVIESQSRHALRAVVTNDASSAGKVTRLVQVSQVDCIEVTVDVSISGKAVRDEQFFHVLFIVQETVGPMITGKDVRAVQKNHASFIVVAAEQSITGKDVMALQTCHAVAKSVTFDVFAILNDNSCVFAEQILFKDVNVLLDLISIAVNVSVPNVIR